MYICMQKYRGIYNRLVPAQHVHFLYVRSHLRAPQNGHIIILTKILEGFIFE